MYPSKHRADGWGAPDVTQQCLIPKTCCQLAAITLGVARVGIRDKEVPRLISSNKEWVGRFHFKSDWPYLLALPYLKGKPVGGLVRPPGRSSLKLLELCLYPVGRTQAWMCAWESVESSQRCSVYLSPGPRGGFKLGVMPSEIFVRAAGILQISQQSLASLGLFVHFFNKTKIFIPPLPKHRTYKSNKVALPCSWTQVPSIWLFCHPWKRFCLNVLD